MDMLGLVDERSETKDEEFAAYLEYNKVLRSWFVAFGVGGPALILVNQSVSQRLVAAHQTWWVASFFLSGAAAQVAGALINKIANCYAYSVKSRPELSVKWWVVLSRWLLEQFWIDITLDAATILAFGMAARRLMTIFAGQP
jgi:hypothetical protein